MSWRFKPHAATGWVAQREVDLADFDPGPDVYYLSSAFYGLAWIKYLPGLVRIDNTKSQAPENPALFFF
jgi:hypothetical protein